MTQKGFAIALVLLMLPLIVLPLLSPTQYVAGRIRIPAADIHAEVMTASHGPDCGCCGVLWQGGVAYTTADLSGVKVYDTAELVTVDGDRMVLECVEVVSCLRVGSTLIGWRGILRAEGDVLLVSGGKAYRFVRL